MRLSIRGAPGGRNHLTPRPCNCIYKYMLHPQLAFGISVAAGFIVWGLVVAKYCWPILRRLGRDDALRPLLALHSFRFIGLGFIVPGVVSPSLPAAFAVPAAVGDLGAATLALLAFVFLPQRVGTALTWAFTLWGTADLLFAFFHGSVAGLLPGQLGTMYFVVTVAVPLLLITHGLVAALLLRVQPAQVRALG
jgi:hypothetical protein